MSDERRRRGVLRCDLVMGVACAFLVLTSTAMAAYSGGNTANEGAHGYSFARNFFSDLGATRAYLDRLNAGSAVLFILALALIGASVILLAFELSTLETRGRGRRLGRSAIGIGIVSGAAFVGVGAVPWNVSGSLHLLLVQIAFGFMLLLVLIMVSLQAANGWSRFYVACNLVYVLVLAAYVAVLFIGPDPELTVPGLEFQVIAQKVVVYSSIANVALQAFGLRAYLKSPGGAAGRAAAEPLVSPAGEA